MRFAELVVIFPAFEDVDTVRKTLPPTIEECRRAGAPLIVHDCSEQNREAMRAFLDDACVDGGAFTLFTSPMSMAAARNLCLKTALMLHSPSYLCMLEDDHGLRDGALTDLVSTMQANFGKIAPNGLRYGLFSGCVQCWKHLHKFGVTPEGHLYPELDNQIHALGGANSCFRAAPTSHWLNVLEGYDPDEYMISNWQTRQINFRNYYRGFTSMYVNGGNLAFSIDRVGQGYSQKSELRRWDETYTASDSRSRFFGKSE